MKFSALNKVMLVSISATTLLVSLAQADSQARQQNRSGILEQNEEERYVMVTGSHLPQKVKLKSIGTTTPYNVRVYTKRELESTGRQTPAGALSVLDPSITISHR